MASAALLVKYALTVFVALLALQAVIIAAAILLKGRSARLVCAVKLDQEDVVMYVVQTIKYAPLIRAAHLVN